MKNTSIGMGRNKNYRYGHHIYDRTVLTITNACTGIGCALYQNWHCWKKDARTGIGIEKIPIPVLAQGKCPYWYWHD
jgi:hypothetical protein